MISVDRIHAAAQAIDPVFLNTPQYHSETLSRLLGVAVVCKIETANPIGNFKGRGMDWWVRCQKGVTRVVCASAGNLGQALTYAGRRAGVAVEIFAAETANPAKIAAMRRLGAQVHLHGKDFDAAKAEGGNFANNHGWPFPVDGRDAEIAEGAGTIAFELEKYPAPIDVIYVPVGNGSLVNGIGAWCRAHMPTTKIIGVCAEGAPAMERSWRQNKLISADAVKTIADGIAVRVPVPESLPPLASAVNDMMLVSDEQIIAAMRAYYDYEHIISEPTGAVSLAAVMANAPIDQGKTVVTIVTGANIDPQRREEWLRYNQS